MPTTKRLCVHLFIRCSKTVGNYASRASEFRSQLPVGQVIERDNGQQVAVEIFFQVKSLLVIDVLFEAHKICRCETTLALCYTTRSTWSANSTSSSTISITKEISNDFQRIVFEPVRHRSLYRFLCFILSSQQENHL